MVSLRNWHWGNWLAVRMILAKWFDNLEERFSYKQVECVQKCLSTVKISCSPVVNVNETLLHCYIIFFFNCVYLVSEEIKAKTFSWYIIYQTWETVLHRDVQMLRRELMKFKVFGIADETLSGYIFSIETKTKE